MEDSLVCTACKVPLSTQALYKAHYKTDFHTYNLKRKLVSLPPVSEEVFAQKQEEAAALASLAPQRCDCCGNTFSSLKLLQKHQQGQQKKSRAAPAAPSVDSTTTCLFCNAASASIETNLQHMLMAHSFFIPDVEYVFDLEGLLEHLQNKVRVGLMCLYCGKTCRMPQAVQQHMIDKQHTFMNTEEDEEEYRTYYNWGEESSYELPSLNSEEVSAEAYVDLDSVGNDSSYSQIVLPKEVAQPVQLMPTGEIKLSNSKILGHKQYARYYRQYFRPRPKHEQLIAALALEYKKIPRRTSWKRGVLN